MRSVAGMINNCGILDRASFELPAKNHSEPHIDAESLHKACAAVYRIYRSSDPQDHPDSPFCAAFRSKHSHSTPEPPIRFLGLLDCVGSLGVPKVSAGETLSFEFFDQKVSYEVQTVVQGLATHDRLFCFKPTYVRRSDQSDKYPQTKFESTEVWFPGARGSSFNTALCTTQCGPFSLSVCLLALEDV